MPSPIPEPDRCQSLFGFALETTTDLGVVLPGVPGPPDLELVTQPVTDLPVAEEQLVYSDEPALGAGAAVTAYKGAQTAMVRFRGVDEFRIGRNLIECRLLSPEFGYLVKVQFLGIVMTLWMELRGIPVLHGSGAVVDGRGVGFLASKGGGKTSLAAAMARAGYPMLGDDLLALDVGPNGVMIRPAYPQLRMEPDVAAHFAPGWESLPIVHPDHEKRRVPLDMIGEFAAGSAPLARLYLPQRQEHGDIEVIPLPGTAALVNLLSGSFLPYLVAAFGLEQQRLHLLGKAANTVPIRVLRYPAGFDRLPEVVAAVVADLAT